MGPAHEHGGVLSDLAPTPDPSSSFLEFHMVFAQSAVLPSAVPAVSAPTRLRLPDLLQAPDLYADFVLSGRSDPRLQFG